MNQLRKWISAALCLVLAASMALPAAAASLSHGTSDTIITEDMVNNTPPKDYKVNSATQGAAIAGKYNEYFLAESLQTVSIEIEENNLNFLLQNAADEPYVMTTSVTIGDTTLGYCGLRTKGNYTLAHAYTDNKGSDRFSFTVNFGKYVKKADYGSTQNFYGCEKISFNNFFFDKSMMKEFFALKLMSEMGLPTPQYGLAKLYINGEYYGVYFMVESLDTSILEQYYGVKENDLSSYLCKPTGTNLLYSQIAEDPSPLYEYSEETYLQVEDMLPTAIEWVRKLNCLSSGTDFDGNTIDVNSGEYLELLSQVMDVDETVRYFAAHSWLCQMDNMFTERQNYGLYISPEGISTMIPWDYDLSFGCFYPSTAESTANYPIDVMYKLDAKLFDQAQASAARIYSTYPLFNVIYQNETLLELYHGYMLDCSRIAALGGTVEATGKAYDPGYFNSFIEAMEGELVAAASETLADNVYYMNGIRQPKDVQSALPNLSKIIALRAVGVWAQVTGVDTTVSGSGCNLEALGNGSRGESSASGALTVVNPATGIFVTAQYEGTKRGAAVNLAVETLAEDSDIYLAVEELLEPGFGDTLLVYRLVHTGNVSSDFTLTVPISPDWLDRPIQFYTYSGSELTPLEMTAEENLFSCTTEKLSYLVITVSGDLQWLWIGGICAAAAVVLIVSVLLVSKRRKKKEL